jgi:site-specific DNA recombinase
MRGRRKKETESRARRTVLYVRCSTDEQAREGSSLPAQEARLRAFALATDRTIDEVVIDDGYSAKDLNRPGIGRVLNDVKTGSVETVIVLKLDRITRSVRDLANLLDLFAKANAALVSVGESLDTQTAAGRMVVNMLGVVAQWERETIGERTAFAHAHRRTNGKVYSGHAPFGYRVDGDNLVPDAKKQRALAMIRSLHKNGEGASLRMIANALTAEKVNPPRGAQWYASSVKAIIDSRMYQERVSANAST